MKNNEDKFDVQESVEFTWSDFKTELVFGGVSSVKPENLSNQLELAQSDNRFTSVLLTTAREAAEIEATEYIANNQSYPVTLNKKDAPININDAPKTERKRTNFLDRLRRWVDSDEDTSNRSTAKQIEPRRQTEQFIVTIARAIGEVMQAEALPFPPDQIVIPPEYVVFLSEDDDREWQGMKRRTLEQSLYYVLAEHARDLAGKVKLATTSFSVELRVDRTLAKNEVRIQHSWEESLSSSENVTAKPLESQGSAKLNKILPNQSAPIAQQKAPAISIKATENNSPPLYRLEIWRGNQQQSVVPVFQPQITIGRKSQKIASDIPLDDPEISRPHAILTRDSTGKLWITHKGKNPTLVSGREVSDGQPTPVTPQDSISICSYVLRILPPFEITPPISTPTLKAIHTCPNCKHKFSKNIWICPKCGYEITRISHRQKPNSSFGDALKINTPPVNEAVKNKSIFAVGDVLSESYRVEKFIGWGGFGDIYTVVDVEDYLSEERVLKLLRNNLPFLNKNSDELLARFQSQYKAWKVLSDKEPDFIVRLFNLKKVEDRPALFMEYMKGGNLRALVKNWGGKPQTAEQLTQLLRLLLQACQAVNVLHTHKLIHRDIKPDNFLLDESQQICKICDFELLTKSGSDEPDFFAGTPNFIPPEVFDNKTISTAWDIYALGVCFYYLLSGQFPFFDENSGDAESGVASMISPSAKEKFKNRRLQSLTELNPLVSSALDQIVSSCIDLEPSNRPQTVTDLLNQLQQLGIGKEEQNSASSRLADLLSEHLPPKSVARLARTLENKGFRSMSEQIEQQQKDIIEEFCHTESPFEILRNYCGGLFDNIADALGIEIETASDNDEIVSQIVKELGFWGDRQEIKGFSTIKRNLEKLQADFLNSNDIHKRLGQIDTAFKEIEFALDLLVNFYGQMFYGQSLDSQLSKIAQNRPLTFGIKVQALRSFCAEKPKIPLAERVEKTFRFPLLKTETFDKINQISKNRNSFAHNRIPSDDFYEINNFGTSTLELSVGVADELAANRYSPRLIQITSSQRDIYGRYSYEGFDENDNKEKIFLKQEIRLGQIYFVFPFSNPARVNPLIFPCQL
jgi:serine/threonine protein kinase